MGLGLIFPLLLILNLRMGPGVAGLGLIPTTLPMVILAPLTGRWYDRSGGRVPMTFGFVILAVSGVLLAITVSMVQLPVAAARATNLRRRSGDRVDRQRPREGTIRRRSQKARGQRVVLNTGRRSVQHRGDPRLHRWRRLPDRSARRLSGRYQIRGRTGLHMSDRRKPNSPRRIVRSALGVYPLGRRPGHRHVRS